MTATASIPSVGDVCKCETCGHKFKLNDKTAPLAARYGARCKRYVTSGKTGGHLHPCNSYDVTRIKRGGPPVCRQCKDTHRVSFVDDDGTRKTWMCTGCPTPCQKCRQGGFGPFCETTPCGCDCHANSYQYKDRR